MRLGSLLSTNRVVTAVACTALEDAVAVAAGRLARHAHADAHALAAAIGARESESPTAIGNGVGVPHAIVPGATLEAALVTLADPLRVRTPDGLPLTLLVVLVDGDERPRFLDVLAQVARLAAHGLAQTLHRLRDPRQVLSRLAVLETAL